MTGTETLSALTAALTAEMPDCDVRPAFTGQVQRDPLRPQVVLQLLSEQRTPGADTGTSKLGVTLYTPRKEQAGDILTAVCGALENVACPVQSVARGEMRYDGALGCTVVACTVTVGTTASSEPGEENGVPVYVDGKAYLASSVRVSVSSSSRSYGSVGEEIPHTVVSTGRTYTVVLSDFLGADELPLTGSFSMCVRGVRYSPCTLKEWKDNTVTVTAGGAERLPAAGGEPNGTV